MLLKLSLSTESRKLIKGFENSNKKKIVKRAKVFIQAGGAKVAPPISSILGQFGINLLEFCDRFNKKTKSLNNDFVFSVQVLIYTNKSFDFSVKPLSSEELFFSFQLLPLLKNNCDEKFDNLLIAFYKLYVVFLHTRCIPEAKSLSPLTTNYLKQLFGYIKSFF